MSMETETTILSAFPNGWKTIAEETRVRRKEINPKEQYCESHSQESELKS